MTDLTGPFDGVPWSQAQWYRFAALWSASGIIGSPAASISAGDFAVTSSGLTVSAAVGRYWIRGSGYEPDATKSATAVANSNASLSRRDRLVIRRNISTQTTTLAIVQGTPAASPTAPAITQVDTGIWEEPLCSFLVPPNNGTTLSGFVDERAWLDPVAGQLNFATTAARDAHFPAPTKGLIAMVDGAMSIHDGTAWRLHTSRQPVLASIAARNSYFAGILQAGDSALVAGKLHVYDGTTWRFRLTFKISAVVTDSNGLYSFAHGAGQTPTAWACDPTAQATDVLNTIINAHASSENSTNLTARFTRSDTHSYLASNTVSFSAWADF